MNSWIELSLDTTNEAVDWVYTLLAKAIAVEDIHICEYSDRLSIVARILNISKHQYYLRIMNL